MITQEHFLLNFEKKGKKSIIQGRNCWGRWGRAPPQPAFHTLAKDMSLNRGATHFTLGLRPCIISSFILHIYLRPNVKITQLRPWYIIIKALSRTDRQSNLYWTYTNNIKREQFFFNMASIKSFEYLWRVFIIKLLSNEDKTKLIQSTVVPFSKLFFQSFLNWL